MALMNAAPVVTSRANAEPLARSLVHTLRPSPKSVVFASRTASAVGQQALVANRTARARYDSAFGRYTFVTSLGQAAGPALMVAFGGSAAIPDTGSIFVATVAMSTLLLLATLFVSGARETSARFDAASGSVRELMRRPSQ